MDRTYDAYCLADPVFYDSPGRVQGENLDFALVAGPVPAGWTRYPLDDWLVYRPEGVPLRPQGWKIHASACLDNAEEILGIVWDYCIPRRVAFKFLSGRHILLLANAKYAHRGGSGKFITIYPGDDNEFRRVLEELGDALEGQPGPYILSDLRWREGPLYVRYGQFVERYCLSPSGRLQPAIEDPTGGLVPDRREPTFRVPPWLTLPDFLLPHLEARNSTKVDSLPYRIERPLHFSNGGGLYAGEDLRTGERVVLKEARPHAGVDMTGTDAVTRLRREGEILQRLAGLDEVPGFRGCFTLGDHNFLIEEFVEGTRLYSAVVERYPLLLEETDERAVAEYTSWALDTYARIERAVAAIHERGVVIGDFHGDNVLVRQDGRIVIIDFEVAAHISEGWRPTLAGPGFVAPRDRIGFDIDRYSLACLRLFLFLPLTALLDLDRGKAQEYAADLGELFPVPCEFFAEAVEIITAGGPDEGMDETRRRTPELTADPAGWQQGRHSMTQAILLSATPDRDDRLFPGDIRQFEAGGLNLAYGAAGVLYALEVTGAGRYPQYEEWLLARATRPQPGFRLGFYDGLHGVAYVLDLLGYRIEALKILDMCGDELRGKWDRLPLDLMGGLAGIGLNLAHFAAVTGDRALRDTALEVADAVAQRLGDEESVPAVSGGEHPYAGLLRGSSGPALLFVRLQEQTGEPAFLDLAETALRQDLRRCVRREEDGSLEVEEGWRTMPYLEDGSVGIGMVLEDYLAHCDDERFAADAAAIRLAAKGQFYVEPGLFHGRAGMILHLSRRHPPGTAGSDPIVARHVRRLGWHALSYKGHLAFPGEELLRLSMDFATGTAGVLLALGAALHPQPVHLPFLPPRGVDRDATQRVRLASERR